MERIYGVYDATSGYANGTGEHPTYEEVIAGDRGFVETVEVTYDPERVSLSKLLTYYFKVIDPTISVLGSTGTGKSTSVSLILHRISELSPKGHIVMIDPHGEYSAAFKGCGETSTSTIWQLPYWLMNFEEHCEVFLTTQGADRQRDADILAKCLLAARTKGKDLDPRSEK